MKNTFKKYMVYFEDGEHCYKEAIPATSEKDAKEYVAGNGEVIAVKDISKDYPISTSKVYDALKNANFGETEIDLIIRTLTKTNIANID